MVDLQLLAVSRCAVVADVEVVVGLGGEVVEGSGDGAESVGCVGVVAEPVVPLRNGRPERVDGALDVGDLVVDGVEGGTGAALVFGVGGGLALLPGVQFGPPVAPASPSKLAGLDGPLGQRAASAGFNGDVGRGAQLEITPADDVPRLEIGPPTLQSFPTPLGVVEIRTAVGGDRGEQRVAFDVQRGAADVSR